MKELNWNDIVVLNNGEYALLTTLGTDYVEGVIAIINGKPIYRKIISGTLGVTQTETILGNIGKNKKILSLKAVVQTSSRAYETADTNQFYNSSDGNVIFYVSSNAFAGGKATIYVEYMEV